jgi:hypothetical protein
MPRTLPAARALAFAATIAGGCSRPPGIGGPCGVVLPDGTNRFATGSEPCRQQLYFPVGATMDPDGDVLYVTNANADLRYSGGTLAAVDVQLWECARDLSLAGCSPVDASCAALPPSCQGYDPKTLDKVGRFRDSSGLGCRPAFLDPSILECDEEPFLTDAVRIGNFGGLVALQPGRPAPDPLHVGFGPSGFDNTCAPGEGDCTRRLWLPVRGDPSITFVNVRKPASTTAAPSVTLDCGDTSGNPEVGIPNVCTRQRITVRDFHTPSAPGYTCQTDPSTCVQIPTDPFGVFLDEGLSPDGSPYHRLLVSHLVTGEVTLVDASVATPISTADQPAPLDAIVDDVRGGFFTPDGNGRQGSFALAPRVAGDPGSLWYLSSRVNPTIGTFRVANVGLVLPAVLPAGNFSVAGGPYASGADVRDLAVDACRPPDTIACKAINAPCALDGDCCTGQCRAADAQGPQRCGPGNTGCRAFFVDNAPPSLFVADTRIDPTLPPAGVPRNEVVDIVPVCQGPSHLAVRRDGDTVRIYVVCFDAGMIDVVDPDQAQVVDTIIVGAGANEIAFNFGPEVTPRTTPRPRRGYVTEYLDMAVAVVDLEPTSRTFNRVIGRIGLTQPPPVMQ